MHLKRELRAHERARANARALMRIHSEYIGDRKPHARKIAALEHLRSLHAVAEPSIVLRCLDWKKERQAFGGGDPLLELRPEQVAPIWARAQEEDLELAGYTKPAPNPEPAELEHKRVQEAERELLELLRWEYPQERDRVDAINRELAALGAPVPAPDEFVRLAVARIALRLREGLPILARAAHKIAGEG
jgi:hypothetical protein